MVINNFIEHLLQSTPRDLLLPLEEIENLVKDFFGRHHFPGKTRPLIEELLWDYLPKLPHPLLALKSLHFLINQQGENFFYPLLANKTSSRQLLALPNLSQSLFFSLAKYPELLLNGLPVTSLSLEEFQVFLDKFMDKQKTAKDNKDIYIKLRFLKLAAFTHILLADFFEIDDFEMTTKKISLFADTSLHWASAEVGLDKEKVSIIAMGKLGGEELNYSSDIDLLFVADDSLTRKKREQLEKSFKKLIDLIGRNGEDGFVFRVDNQIRPEGFAGMLLMTLGQYRSYYERRAKSWEKQALIKARPITGPQSLKLTFEQLAREVAYESVASTKAILFDIGEMKKKIENQLIVRQTNWGNIKLGAGGIRDIEFLVQFLQLHHGRPMPQLRVVGTLEGLKQLFHFQILSRLEHEQLKEYYILLRRMEHFLQVENFRPLRQIPQEGSPATTVLSRKLGFPSGDIFSLKYRQITLYVKSKFREVFEKTAVYLSKIENIRDELTTFSAAVGRVLDKMESDYFLRFSEKTILGHARLINDYLESQKSQIHYVAKGSSITLTLVSQDHLGAFAKICGLFSSWGLFIDSGESYTCDSPGKENDKKSANRYYRRPQKSYEHFLKPGKLILGVLNCHLSPQVKRQELPSPKQVVSITQSFLDGKTGGLESEEWQRITLNLIQNQSLKDGHPSRPHPITFKFDNTVDPTYTLLEIFSKDSFLFLFQFTTALSSRGYYLGKVELSTDQGQVYDKLYLTDQRGNKLHTPEQLIQLKITISLIKTFTHYLLKEAADPKMALKQFNLVINMWANKKADLLNDIGEEGKILKRLAKILGSGEVWEDFIRLQFDDLKPILSQTRAKSYQSKEALNEAFETALKKTAAKPLEKQIEVINQLKDREMFRIDLRFLTRRIKHFTDFTKKISQLADVTVTQAFKLAKARTVEKKGAEPGRCAIFALGKWGGNEMGYASDLEIMWVYASDAPEAQSWYLSMLKLFRSIIKCKKDGIFELDFRLRPDGEVGPLLVTLNRFKKYYDRGGEAYPFERQSLIRLRYCTGDESIRNEVIRHAKDFVYSSEPPNLLEISRLRARQKNELVKRSQVNIKYSPGGLVEAEYFIQILQLAFGFRYPAIRQTNTLLAAEKLFEQKLLAEKEYQIFQEAYHLLRAVINSLRIVRGHAKDLILPDKASLEFAYLERRLKTFGQLVGIKDTWSHIREQMDSLHFLFTKVLK